MALHANSRPAPGELPVFALTKCPLAHVTISHCEPYSQECFLTDAARYPLVLSNFFFVVALPIERTEINFSHVPAPKLPARLRYH
jgi:hypothetical protein